MKDPKPTFPHFSESRADSIRDKQWNEDDEKEKNVAPKPQEKKPSPTLPYGH